MHEESSGRSRLIDAAIGCFAATGFDVSVRTIAQRAGVTAGLIRHHFGSKDELRRSCDDEVLRRYRELKVTSMRRSPGPMFGDVAADPEGGILLAYVVRAVSVGGAPARRFFDHFVEESRAVMAEAVDSGLVIPSDDDDARTRQLVAMLLGSYIVQFALDPALDIDEPGGTLQRAMGTNMLPLLEIFTHGVFSDDRYLAAYREYVEHDAPQSAESREGEDDD